MIDADVQTAIKSVLDTRLPAAGISGAIVSQSFNPTTQGASLEPQLVFTKITARRWGWQGRKYALVAGPSPTFDKTESYWIRATYQLSGFMNQDPTDPASLSAYDVLDICAAIMQSEEGLAIFRAASIGVDRITDIRTPSSRGDDDRFMVDPSFDFVLSYQNELASVVDGALAGEGTLVRV